MNDDALPPGTEDRWGRPSQHALLEVAYPSIWLIFLAFPTVATIASDAALGWKILSGLGIAAFAILYMMSWWITRPLRGLGEAGNTWLWFCVLAVTAAATIPAIGGAAMSTGPFLIAVLAFRLPLRHAIGPVLLLDAAFILWAVLAGSPFIYWVPSMMGATTLIMLGISSIMVREEHSRDLAHQLDLTQQRERIGRDVHDVLGHSLTVITVKTELARKLMDVDATRAAAELDEVLALSREALSEVRATVGQLRTPDWSAQVASARTALRAAQIDAKLPGTAVEIPSEQKTLLAWCLREAVTNVIRHSQASHCAVEAGPGHLIVTDDGRGISPDRTHGNGLRGMRERVEEAGGTLRIGPSPEAHHHPGTRLEITLP